MSSIKKSRSNRGKRILHLDGFSFHLNSTSSKGTKYWRCIKYPMCGGTAVEKPGRRPACGRIPHNHAANPERVDTMMAVAQLKQRAKTDASAQPKALYRDSLCQAVENQSAASFPPFESLSSTLYRLRRESFPSCAGLANDLRVEDQFTRTRTGERFLLIDSRYRGRDGNTKRMLVFSSDRQLEMLSNARTIAFDGTFNMCPSQFTQIFVIHGNAEDTFHPLVFALLENKDCVTYRTLISGLQNACGERNLTLNPTQILSDFEASAQNVFAQHFPNSRMTGCNFHHSQALWRFIQSKGLQSDYVKQKNLQLRKLFRTVAALPFLPAEGIARNFHGIIRKYRMDGIGDLPAGRVKEVLDGLDKYYKRQWIPKTLMLSVFLSEHRTNNIAEAFNSKMTRLLESHKPGLYKLIDFLKKEEAEVQGRMAQLTHGDGVIRRNAKSVLKDAKVADLNRKLASGDIGETEFLERVASQITSLG